MQSLDYITHCVIKDIGNIICFFLTISPNIVSTSYCSRLHNVKTKRDKRTAKKSVKVQAVLEDDTLNNKPIHFGVYK